MPSCPVKPNGLSHNWRKSEGRNLRLGSFFVKAALRGALLGGPSQFASFRGAWASGLGDAFLRPCVDMLRQQRAFAQRCSLGEGRGCGESGGKLSSTRAIRRCHAARKPVTSRFTDQRGWGALGCERRICTTEFMAENPRPAGRRSSSCRHSSSRLQTSASRLATEPLLGAEHPPRQGATGRSPSASRPLGTAR
jgi:hypothetical protein